eukprot:673444-Hanusia_phi.AAC.2
MHGAATGGGGGIAKEQGAAKPSIIVRCSIAMSASMTVCLSCSSCVSLITSFTLLTCCLICSTRSPAGVAGSPSKAVGRETQEFLQLRFDLDDEDGEDGGAELHLPVAPGKCLLLGRERLDGITELLGGGEAGETQWYLQLVLVLQDASILCLELLLGHHGADQDEE